MFARWSLWLLSPAFRLSENGSHDAPCVRTCASRAVCRAGILAPGGRQLCPPSSSARPTEQEQRGVLLCVTCIASSSLPRSRAFWLLPSRRRSVHRRRLTVSAPLVGGP